jgi:hypothetical protein
MLNRILRDIQRAQEYQEEYLRLRSLFKGENATGSGALIEFMELDYVPGPIKKFLLWKVKLVNRSFAWMFDWHRVRLITIILMGIIIGLVQGF